MTEWPGVVRGQVGAHVPKAVHAREDCGDIGVLQDEALRELRHGHVVRRDFGEAPGPFDAF